MLISGKDFDGSQGGELILHEPRLVIRLRRGDFFFFPSACITHANLPIPDGMSRRSLVLYMSGGLTRYHLQGHQTKNQWLAKPLGRMEVEKHDAAGEERWLAGWELYSTLEELHGLYLAGKDA